ncbi:MAG: hypothetical protein AUJ01_10285 [Acidobacteria bacterium 13_1_40CM_3_65_5]|nr:MAG: hypothetical protein AUJ01_10285 [Acidobacteria bacterium 13_1_40CM_3_65_5]
MAANLLCNADNLHHFGDRVHAYDVGAGEDDGGDGGRCAPVAFGRGALANRVAHEGLARRADQQRPVERGRQLRQARQHTITVGRPFGKPEAGVEDDLLERDAGLSRRQQALPELACHIRDDILVHRFTNAPPRSATARASAGSNRRPLTSLTMAAPASSAAAATPALYVSTEIGTRSRPARPLRTGRIRASSSPADTGFAPGRVDSPPTSITSAPSASIRSAASIAIAGSSVVVDSANESGVTLRMPITRHRSPSDMTPDGSVIV